MTWQGEIEPFGDAAVRFRVPDGVDRRSLLGVLRTTEGVRDVVLAEAVGCVVSRALAGRDLAERIAEVIRSAPAKDTQAASAPRMHTIEVVYDGADLEEVATALGVDRERVIALHGGQDLVVSMLGFLPGFAYLRGLPPELHLPRRAPRPRVPAGSVAIAAGYGGIYPSESAGGWHLLGRAVGFDAFATDHATLQLDDRVRFVPAGSALRLPPPLPAAPADVVDEEPSGLWLEVVRAQGLALPVDAGRAGHAHEGVPAGGPLVPAACHLANARAGNGAAACSLEVTGSIEVVAHGGAIRVADDARAALLAPGDRFVTSTAGTSRVRYLAVAGGLDLPVWLGSRCALRAAGFGAPVRRGDRLRALEVRGGREGVGDGPATADRARAIELVPGPDAGEGLEVLLRETFRISASSDRSGTRLEGPSLPAPPAPSSTRASTPMVLGAIEQTPSGPIVLGPDHPTTGGYPVVAVVASSSIAALHALPFGARVRFVRADAGWR